MSSIGSRCVSKAHRGSQGAGVGGRKSGPVGSQQRWEFAAEACYVGGEGGAQTQYLYWKHIVGPRSKAGEVLVQAVPPPLYTLSMALQVLVVWRFNVQRVQLTFSPAASRQREHRAACV
jgi:hypothetical protein